MRETIATMTLTMDRMRDKKQIKTMSQVKGLQNLMADVVQTLCGRLLEDSRYVRYVRRVCIYGTFVRYVRRLRTERT